MRPPFAAILAVAAAYTLTGWLSLSIALPPYQVSMAFLAAGVAQSAMLIVGPRVWPGIFIGSLATQALSMLFTNAGGLHWLSLLSAAAAVLQAYAGYRLAQRLIGFPHPLDTPSSTLRFMGVVGPISCLVSASVSVPLLVWQGAIAPDDLAFCWWNWWLGDTLGVLLASPLVFVLFGQPRSYWHGRRLAITVPLLVTSLLTLLVFQQMQQATDARVREQFARESAHAATLVEKRLDAQIDTLLALGQFVAIHTTLDSADFHRFVSPILARYSGTYNFTWNPYVTDTAREAFEAAHTPAGDAPFHIRQRDESAPRRTSVAHTAPDYLPILYVEPLATNQDVVGLDPRTVPAAATAIARSLALHRPVASPGFVLTQELQAAHHQRGVVVYQPVYRPAPPQATALASTDDTPADTDNHAGLPASTQLAGIVSGAFRMDDMLSATLRDIAGLNMEACLIDRAAAPGERRLAGPTDCDSMPRQAKPPMLENTFPIRFGEREWEIHLRASPAYLGALHGGTAWIAIAVGMVITGILGAFLLMATGHTRRISRLVEQRTAELAATTRSLREQQAALARAQRIAQIGSWEMALELAADPPALRCSDELRRLLHLPAHGVLTLDDLLQAVCDADTQRLAQIVERLTLGPSSFSLDCHPRQAEDHVMRFQLESESVAGDHRLRLRGTVQDVTAARKAEADIQHLAHYDVLTGLPNRNLWLSRARSALQSASRHGDSLAVLFLDLDHFKTVNDSLGHPVGDRLLAEISRRLSASLRAEDVLARIGGDEFVALLTHIHHPGEAAAVARKMLDVLAEPVVIDTHELRLSVSIGIALHPIDGDDVDTLVKHADTAMYSAKDGGRNTFQFFVPEMNARALQRLMLESGLRRAIERDELTLHYQPQTDILRERIVGAEALVRWHHPEMGLIMPDRFITVAEESGLIVPLGNWVLQSACRQQAQWHRAGKLTLQVSINISALQFRKPDFVDNVTRILAETGADPSHIELEITESALMQPTEELFARLHALNALGLTLALDDFGTGYSSLAYLKRLPIRRLKLDRSFVKDLPGNTEDAAIASAALSMARNLGIEVVAEGVETGRQRDYLSARGCAVMQGYLFSRPIPATDFERYFHEASLAGPTPQRAADQTGIL